MVDQFLENGNFEDFCKEWGIKHVSSSPYMFDQMILLKRVRLP
jgi:hypothetical protein